MTRVTMKKINKIKKNIKHIQQKTSDEDNCTNFPSKLNELLSYYVCAIFTVISRYNKLNILTNKTIKIDWLNNIIKWYYMVYNKSHGV